MALYLLSYRSDTDGAGWIRTNDHQRCRLVVSNGMRCMEGGGIDPHSPLGERSG